MCTSQNAQLVVNQIPSELLVYIFQIVQEAVHCMMIPFTPAWIPFTWVCRHWRNVSITAPILWSTIRVTRHPLSTTLWFTTFLERAVGALLDLELHLECGTDSCRQILGKLRSRASTIRRFTLWLSDRKSPISDFLFTHMTELEELTLLDFCTEDGDAEPLIGTQQDFPRLKRLETAQAYFSWSSPIYWSLRSLTLEKPRVRPTVEQLLRVLGGCAELETLKLRDALPLSAVAGGAVPIRLPALRQLDVRGHHSEVSSFITLIEVPRSCKVDVYHIMRETDEGSLDPILAVIPTQPLFRSLIHQSTDLSLQMEDQEVTLFASSPHGVHLWNHLTGPFEDDPEITPSTWKAFIDAFSYAPLTHLTVLHNSLQLVTSEMWQMCFSRFHQLESLAVGPWFVRLRTGNLHIFETVLAALQASSPLGTGLYCPRLRAVEITGMGIDAAGADTLLAMLERRTSGGAPLEDLSFRSAYCAKEVDAVELKARINKLVKLTPKCVWSLCIPLPK